MSFCGCDCKGRVVRDKGMQNTCSLRPHHTALGVVPVKDFPPLKGWFRYIYFCKEDMCFLEMKKKKLTLAICIV